MYNSKGVRLADLMSFFLNILCKTKLFHFHRIFKKDGGEGTP